MIAIPMVVAMLLAASPAQDTIPLTAVLRHVAAALPAGTHFLDSRPISGSEQVGGVLQRQNRPAHVNELLAAQTSFRIARTEDVTVCDSVGCTIKGGVAIVAVGEPEQTPVEGVVEVRVRVQKLSGLEHHPFSEYESIVTVSRSGRHWSVVKEELIRIT